MGGYSRSDLLTFNEVQLKSMIGIVEDIKSQMIVSKNSYDDYISNSLKPIWTTQSGIRTVGDLQNFSTNDIQNFINYITARIEDLSFALEEVKKIDRA